MQTGTDLLKFSLFFLFLHFTRKGAIDLFTTPYGVN